MWGLNPNQNISSVPPRNTHGLEEWSCGVRVSELDSLGLGVRSNGGVFMCSVSNLGSGAVYNSLTESVFHFSLVQIQNIFLSNEMSKG
ncbi:hypothetical protein TNCT_385531 [Trichonephila clavata]|uniref:Uncharacterized protein n=1 Tax=Trichonephila clavata TaxID=2740835 RepID=A0A8X6HYJ5_TRICU|nr:hypothetical protein TNCT_385531 [Trichonephila clavata]